MYESQGSLKKGILGAIVGSIPGILLWILLGYIGITAAIVGFVIAFGILFCYEKFGGILDKTGVIICAGVLLVSIYVGEHMAWAVVIYDALKDYTDEITLGGCVRNLHPTLSLLEMKGDFFASLFKGYLFGLLGAFGLIRKGLR